MFPNLDIFSGILGMIVANREGRAWGKQLRAPNRLLCRQPRPGAF